MIDNLLSLDTELFHAINTGWINPFLNFIMPIVTNEFGAVLLVGIILITAIIDRKNGWIAFLFVLLAVAISDPLVSRILKPLFARPRPCRVMDVHLLVRCSRSFSFPSAHAVNIFSFTMAYGMVYRKSLFLLLPLATLVALSRVYVGVHYPIDIFVGSVLGIIVGGTVGYYSNSIIQKRKKKHQEANESKENS